MTHRSKHCVIPVQQPRAPIKIGPGTDCGKTATSFECGRRQREIASIVWLSVDIAKESFVYRPDCGVAQTLETRFPIAYGVDGCVQDAQANLGPPVGLMFAANKAAQVSNAYSAPDSVQDAVGKQEFLEDQAMQTANRAVSG